MNHSYISIFVLCVGSFVFAGSSARPQAQSNSSTLYSMSTFDRGRTNVKTPFCVDLECSSNIYAPDHLNKRLEAFSAILR